MIIHAIDIHSAQYPELLKTIKNPPSVLYARGNLDLLATPPGIAIVGTRNATSNGLEITRRITKYCVDQQAVIVSGLALGIDAEAHRACLMNNGATIAVLAGGLHTAEPKANLSLGLQILEHGGLWVSEHPEGTRTQRHHFVPRNRIQVGLSASSIVVESDAKSGTMTHARFCANEGHNLYAVVPHEDGNPLGLNCNGPLEMVKNLNAIPLATKTDYSSLSFTRPVT